MVKDLDTLMITSGPCPSLHPLTSVAAGQLPLIATLPQPWRVPGRTYRYVVVLEPLWAGGRRGGRQRRRWSSGSWARWWCATGAARWSCPRRSSVRCLRSFSLARTRLIPVDRLIDRLWGRGGHRRAPARCSRPTCRSCVGSSVRRSLVTGTRGLSVACRTLISSTSTGSSGWWPRRGRPHRARRPSCCAAPSECGRGSPLADLRDEPFAQAEIARLVELRLAVVEERVEVDLALGRHTELVAELRVWSPSTRCGSGCVRS